MHYPNINIESPIFLLGMPRSGTSWLSQIFESSSNVCVRLSPNYSYRFKNILNENSSFSEWLHILAASAESDDDFMTQEYRRREGLMPKVNKIPLKIQRICIKDTRFHDLYENAMSLFPHARLIYIVRDPRATLNSWWKCKEFPVAEDFYSVWRTGGSRKGEGKGEYWGFDDWCSLTRHYLLKQEKEPLRYKIVVYEELVDMPQKVAKDMFDFCDIPMENETNQFLNMSQKRHIEHPYSVFKSPDVKIQWKNQFPEQIALRIKEELSRTDLERFLQ